MAPNKRLLAAWEDGVPLGIAWWVFADNENKKRFRERHDEGRDVHLQLQYTLEVDLIARLEAGRLQAYGIEEGSDTGPIRIAKYYFSKTAKVDYLSDTVTALGKKFYEVRVQGEREPTEETPPSVREVSMDPEGIIDLSELSAQRKREREQGRLDDTLRSVPTTSREPRETTDQGEREPPQETPPSEPAPSIKSRMGRPLSLPKIREVVRELIDGGEFENLMKKEIVTLIRRRAKQRFPVLFPKPTQPSLNKINEALKAEGWPPPPAEASS
jgi:hypothetical protein